MSDATGRVNVDQFIRAGEFVGKIELYDGVMTPRMPAAAGYCGFVGRLAAHLGSFILPPSAGELYVSECAFFPEGDDGVLLLPDIAYVRAERLPPWSESPGFLQLAPDLAVGVAWPPKRWTHVTEHLHDYITGGVPLVWIVEPAQRTVRVVTGEGVERVVGDGDALDGGEVMPGFTLPMTDLFR